MTDPNLPYIDFGGERRYLARLAPRADFGGLPCVQAANGLIPRAEWFETPDSNYGARILNQGQHGSCTGHGSTTATEIQWLRQGGQPVRFSACYLYGLINGGRDAGAVVSDAMDALMQYGVCTEAEVPPGMIYKRQFPASAMQVAAKYKVKVAYHCDSFDAIVSEILRGRTVSHGITVGTDYANVDANGVAPLVRFPAGGHCQCSYAVRKINGEWMLATQNSWGTTFGIDGKCYLRERHFDRPGQVDAFSVEVVDPTQDNDFPPPMQ